MDWNWLSIHYQGDEFTLFSMPHLSVLMLLSTIVAAIWGYGDRLPGNYRYIGRITIAGLIMTNEIGWHLWEIYYQRWTPQTMLPLHCCTFSNLLCVLLLFKKNQFIYDYIYLVGAIGAILAVLTPSLGHFGFPHFLFFQFFISHGCILITTVYMSKVEHLRPYPRSFFRAFSIAVLLATIAAMVNYNIGSNYLFLSHKPHAATLFDQLPSWPYYIPVAALGLLLLAFLVYLPYYWMDRHKTKVAVK